MSARRFSWSSGARVAYPRWKSVAALELAAAVIIIAVVAAFLLKASSMVLAKVKMVEALNVMHVGKVAVLEHYAVTGRGLPTDMLGEERRSESVGVPEYEKHLSAAAAFAAVASGSGQQAPRTPGWLQDTSAYYTRAGVVDGAVVGIGRVRGVDRPYRTSFWAADAAGGGPVLLWACGSPPPPTGYHVVGTRAADDIPPELLMFPCRTSRPW